MKFGLPEMNCPGVITSCLYQYGRVYMNFGLSRTR